MQCLMECCNPVKTETYVAASDAYNLAYFKIPKCGSSTIMTLMEENIEDTEFYRGSHIVPFYINLFTTCRNPFRRAVSNWLFFKHDKLFNDYKLARYHDRHNITFEDWVRMALQGVFWNHHWEPAVNFVSKRTKFFKLEDIQKDPTALLEFMGLSPSLHLPHERKAKEDLKLKDVYTPVTESLVAKAYMKDFERFGYSLSLEDAE